MTIRERMLAAIKGEMPDILPFSPRLDMWYTANKARGTLPAEYQGKTLEQICLDEGWGIYRLNADLRYVKDSPWDKAMICIGLHFPAGMIWKPHFGGGVEIEINEKGRDLSVTFHTPKGELNSLVCYPEQMEKDGITYPWIKERPIKSLEDWPILGYIFENIIAVPDYSSYVKAVEEIGDDGLICSFLSVTASPMHHIQRTLFDPTNFFILYKEKYDELSRLADSLGHLYNQLVKLAPLSPAEVIYWGANFDETLTYPPYFEKDILPWYEKISPVLKDSGKLLVSHCDGENSALMDLIRRSGIDAAESVCPYPMTKLKLDELYSAWSDKISILGGIPADTVIPQNTSDSEFQDYLNYMLKAVAPGNRFLAGVTDGVPVAADIGRLRRIRDLMTETKLPLEKGSLPSIFKETGSQKNDAVQTVVTVGEFQGVQKAMLEGDADKTRDEVLACLNSGIAAEDILTYGMIKAMDVIGDGFSAGNIFIPEMLRAALAMEAGITQLKDKLASGNDASQCGRILLGTVFGDLHDIGKNLVAIMMRGVGFEVIDIGVNVPSDEFIRQIRKHQPDILALSALLTTTMPEMGNVIDSLKEAGLADRVKVIVGGAPITDSYAKKIGADGYAPNAGAAASLAKKLLACK